MQLSFLSFLLFQGGLLTECARTRLRMRMRMRMRVYVRVHVHTCTGRAGQGRIGPGKDPSAKTSRNGDGVGCPLTRTTRPGKSSSLRSVRLSNGPWIRFALGMGRGRSSGFRAQASLTLGAKPGSRGRTEKARHGLGEEAGAGVSEKDGRNSLAQRDGEVMAAVKVRGRARDSRTEGTGSLREERNSRQAAETDGKDRGSETRRAEQRTWHRVGSGSRARAVKTISGD